MKINMEVQSKEVQLIEDLKKGIKKEKSEPSQESGNIET